MDDLFTRTKEAAIEYFELKEQYEEEISKAFKEYRKRCLIAYIETYHEFQNQYPNFIDVYLKIPPQIVLNNFGAAYNIEKLKLNADELKQGKMQPRFRWPTLIECFMRTYVHDEEFVTVEHSYHAIVTVDYERYDDEYTFYLDKTNILDPVVLDQEVEKFKQKTIDSFKEVYDNHLFKIKKQIASLESHLK